MRSILFFVFVFMMASTTALAQNEVLFNKATEAYNKGEFNKAIGYYEQVIKNGKHSAALYFNLGNCHYKLDAIGPSVYYYEKALLLSPNDKEIQNNLGFAQNMRLDAIEAMPKTAMNRFHDAVVHSFAPNTWGYIAIGAILVFVLGFITYYVLYAATLKRIAFIVANSMLGVAILATILGYLAKNSMQAINPAIVFEREVTITSEPNTRSEKIFALHEGTKVNVLESLDQWSKIKIADGQTGWMPTESIKLLKDF